MKIGILATSFPTRESPSAGLFVADGARALAARGHTVKVLVPQTPSPHSFDVNSDDPWSVRQVPYLPQRRTQGTFYGAGVPDNLVRSWRAWPGLVTYPIALRWSARTELQDCDVLISHWLLPCAWAAGSVRGDRPHLAICHSADLHLLLSLPKRRTIARNLNRNATTMSFVSKQHRKAFLDLVDDELQSTIPCHVAPMGAWRGTAPQRAQCTTLRILYLGRLIRLKGVDRLIRACGSIRGVHLTIAGDGPERDRLQRLAVRLGVAARFVGHVTGQAKEQILATHDVLVVCSQVAPTGRQEGMPTVLAEAMIRSLPVIVTDTGGITEYVQDAVHGRVVPARSLSAITQAIVELRDDVEARHRYAHNATALGERFEWNRWAARVEGWLSSG